MLILLEIFLSCSGKCLLVSYLFLLFSGPFVSMLANKYGCRRITIMGAVISCAAFILSVFSPNIEMLILTYGILGGTNKTETSLLHFFKVTCLVLVPRNVLLYIQS